MKILDIIQEADYIGPAPDDFGEQVEIDWNQLRAALTVIATDPELKGVKPVDAIMFLGIIGDPNADVVRPYLKSPARFGKLTDKGLENVPRWQRIQGEYTGGGGSGGGYSWSRRFDIMINPKFWDQAMSAKGDTPELIAHEARHRGFEILLTNPVTRSQVPPKLLELTWKFTNNYRQGEELEGDSFEHMMLYSIERGASNSIDPDPKKQTHFRSKEELMMFRNYYYQYEAIAKRYIATLQVPPGGYEALRKEVDAKTPGDITIKVVPSKTGGKPIVVGQKAGEEPAAQQSGSKETVIVQRGDTLSKIAQRMGMSLRDIIKANPQIKNPNLIYPGDKVTIP